MEVVSMRVEGVSIRAPIAETAVETCMVTKTCAQDKMSLLLLTFCENIHRNCCISVILFTTEE